LVQAACYQKASKSGTSLTSISESLAHGDRLALGGMLGHLETSFFENSFLAIAIAVIEMAILNRTPFG
jgi:hypothetical protein